jgi:hypothetical protein
MLVMLYLRLEYNWKDFLSNIIYKFMLELQEIFVITKLDGNAKLTKFIIFSKLKFFQIKCLNNY